MVTWLELGYSGSNFLNDACAFMAVHGWKRRWDNLSSGKEVGMAYAGRHDLDDYFVFPGFVQFNILDVEPSVFFSHNRSSNLHICSPYKHCCLDHYS